MPLKMLPYDYSTFLVFLVKNNWNTIKFYRIFPNKIALEISSMCLFSFNKKSSTSQGLEHR